MSIVHSGVLILHSKWSKQSTVLHSLSLSLLEFNRRPGLLFWLSLFPSMSIEIRVLKEAYGMVYSCNAHGTILGIQGSHVTP